MFHQEPTPVSLNKIDYKLLISHLYYSRIIHLHMDRSNHTCYLIDKIYSLQRVAELMIHKGKLNLFVE